jgi:hypothetical protein
VETETELDYSPLFGLLYNTAVEYMDKVMAKDRFIKYAGVVGGCMVTVFAYPYNAQAKILVPNYTSRVVEDVIASVVKVRNSIGYGTYFVIVMATCPKLPAVTYAKLPVDVGKARGFMAVDGEISPVDKDTVDTALSNAFRTFTDEVMLGFADYHRGLHHAVIVRALNMYSPRVFMSGKPPLPIPWGKANLLAIGTLAIATLFTAMLKPGDATAVIPFTFLLIAVAYPWLKPIIEPIINKIIIIRKKRVVGE